MSSRSRSARRIAGAAVLAAVVALGAGLLGGCSSGDDGDANAPIDPADREAAREWTEQICASILEWQDAIGVLVQEGGEPETRDDFVTFLTGSLESSRRLVRELEAAGVPDVPDGQVTADTYVEAFDRARRVTADALEQAQTLPAVINEDQRRDLALVIQDGFGAISATFEEAGNEVDSPELAEAFAENPDCAAVS